MKEYKYYPLLCGLFVASLLTSNILSAAKIVDLGVSIFGTALVIDAGTFIFPLCYILGDLLTEVYGYKQTKKVIPIFSFLHPVTDNFLCATVGCFFCRHSIHFCGI